jgi:hypothetical protein
MTCCKAVVSYHRWSTCMSLVGSVATGFKVDYHRRVPHVGLASRPGVRALPTGAKSRPLLSDQRRNQGPAWGDFSVEYVFSCSLSPAGRPTFATLQVFALGSRSGAIVEAKPWPWWLSTATSTRGGPLLVGARRGAARGMAIASQ